MCRFFDIFFSSIGLIILSPIMLLIAIIIILESPGSPIFRQNRVGEKGVIFKMNKFRSMVKNAPSLGSYKTCSGDTRITRIGRIIRKTSLDELPQLWNVLIGDMSLVGPRPDVPAQQKLYEPNDWEKRTSVKPGITGLAQATKRSSATAEERLEKDFEYIDQRSIKVYFKVLFTTARLILTKLAH